MAKCVLRDGTILSDYGKPYIVAEVNSSHSGSLEIAKEMIAAAYNCGCQCVKFQSWSAESLYSATYYKENPLTKRIVKKFSLEQSQLKELVSYCAEMGIAFSSTPYSEAEVDFLVHECDAPYVKIASMDLDNHKFLKYVARKNVPVILSTGMGTYEEVQKAVSVIREEGNDRLCLLHCISVYPVEAKDVRLNNILGLRELFPDIPIGFSDHSLGKDMAVAAVTLGSAVIEKHLTLDKKKIGMDNQMAAEPGELESLVKSCNRVYEAVGGKDRIVSVQEMEQKKKMRRSIIAMKDIKAGEIITEEMLGAKRPGTGLPLSEMSKVVGSMAVKNIESDTVICMDDIRLKRR